LAPLALTLLSCSKRPSPDRAQAEPSAAGATFAVKRHVKATGQLGPGRGTLVLSLAPPQSGKLTAGTPLSVEGHGADLAFPVRIHTTLEPDQLPVRIPVDVGDGAPGPAILRLSYVWCGTGADTTCHPERAELEVELDTSGQAPGGEAFVVHRPAGS